DLAIPFDLGVSRTVDETGHVEGVAINKGHGLPRDLHVPLKGLAGIPLGLPHLILVWAVHPEQEFFLGALRLTATAVGRRDSLKRLEVVGDIAGQVFQEGWAKADDNIYTLVHADFAQVANDGLDVCEIRPWFAAQMHVPLVRAHISI